MSHIAHPPGIYFSLDEDIYHQDIALGSTSMKKLAENPCSYWFDSPYNSMLKQDNDTPARAFGRAVHKFVLEGREAFERAYAPTEYPGNVKAGKEERERIAASGKEPISRDKWDRIMQAGTIMRANDQIANAFSGGFPEVSVFWEREGIRRKARFDYFKPRAIVDLKSNANKNQIDFKESCRKAIAQYHYHVQAAHYSEARAMVAAFHSDGAVNGDHDAEWLAKVAASKEWAFCWVFYQSEGAPLTWGTTVSPDNPIIGYGRTTLASAENNYREFRDRFGLDTPWVISEPLEELDEADMPAWSFR